MTEEANKPPVDSMKKGNISTATWHHISKEGNEFYTIELSHAFKDQDGNRQYRKISMLPNEALTASNMLNTAFTNLYTLPQFTKPNKTS